MLQEQIFNYRELILLMLPCGTFHSKAFVYCIKLAH